MDYRELAVEFIQEQKTLGNYLGGFAKTWLRKFAVWLEEKAAQHTLALDDADLCACGEPFPESGYCRFCGVRRRHRQ